MIRTNGKRSIVYLATPENAVDKSLTDFLELNFGKNMKLNFIRSPKTFTTINGLADKIGQFEGVGTVIANPSDFNEEQLEAAAETRIKSAVIYKDGSGEWNGYYEGFYYKKTPMINRAKKEGSLAISSR